MSFSFCVLGSGSRGNSTLLAFESDGAARFALIDAGLSPRMTRTRLAPLGVRLEDITDILVTHFDTDHFYHGWLKPIRQHGMNLHLHRSHRSRALQAGLSGREMSLFTDSFDLTDGVRVDPFMLAHDELGVVGFVIEHDERRLGFATDLGRLPESLFERFTGLHALALESNYDRQMELAADRPAYVKQRVMGGLGHLSNEQSLEAAMRIAQRGRLSHIVPLHLSHQCNDPRLIKRLYAEHAPHLLDCLTISNQRHPTPMLHVSSADSDEHSRRQPRTGEQLSIL